MGIKYFSLFLFIYLYTVVGHVDSKKINPIEENLDWYACSTDDDVVVAFGVCGNPEAINKKYKEAFSKFIEYKGVEAKCQPPTKEWQEWRKRVKARCKSGKAELFDPQAPDPMAPLIEKSVKIKLKETVEVLPGMKVTLLSFNHKRPRTGGPTMASAELELIAADAKSNFRLSVSGTQGQPGIKLGATWLQEMYFQLSDWKYDEFIEFKVSKYKAWKKNYDESFSLTPGVFVIFPDGFKIRMKGTKKEVFKSKDVLSVTLSFNQDGYGDVSEDYLLYENGTPVPDATTWVSEKGLKYLDRHVLLESIKDGYVELKVLKGK